MVRRHIISVFLGVYFTVSLVGIIFSARAIADANHARDFTRDIAGLSRIPCDAQVNGPITFPYPAIHQGCVLSLLAHISGKTVECQQVTARECGEIPSNGTCATWHTPHNNTALLMESDFPVSSAIRTDVLIFVLVVLVVSFVLFLGISVYVVIKYAILCDSKKSELSPRLLQPL
jgi:hypothetical protein